MNFFNAARRSPTIVLDDVHGDRHLGSEEEDPEAALLTTMAKINASWQGSKEELAVTDYLYEYIAGTTTPTAAILAAVHGTKQQPVSSKFTAIDHLVGSKWVEVIYHSATAIRRRNSSCC